MAASQPDQDWREPAKRIYKLSEVKKTLKAKEKDIIHQNKTMQEKIFDSVTVTDEVDMDQSYSPPFAGQESGSKSKPSII